jgi:cytochrome c-type biogenesis protein CcmF
MDGTKKTVSGAYYSHVMVPIGIFLLLLTGVGPLLAWRASSFKSLRKNFIAPLIAFWIVVVASLFSPIHPWFDEGVFYAFVTWALAAAVGTAVLSEFVRGALVLHRQTGRNIADATLLLVRRNTRRYGGYVVHLGIVLIFIGFAGYAFNRNAEKELAPGDTMSVGSYTLKNLGNTQESNLNYDTEFAQLQVSEKGKDEFTLAPERRLYHASGQPQTMVATHSTILWDLYVVYEGVNPDTGMPIIKAFLNPLVNWIWAGFVIMVFGTLLALLPNTGLQARPAPAAGGDR